MRNLSLFVLFLSLQYCTVAQNETTTEDTLPSAVNPTESSDISMTTDFETTNSLELSPTENLETTQTDDLETTQTDDSETTEIPDPTGLFLVGVGDRINKQSRRWRQWRLWWRWWRRFREWYRGRPVYFSFRKSLHQYWRVHQSRKSEASAFRFHNFLELTTAVVIFLLRVAVSLYSGNLAGEISPPALTKRERIFLSKRRNRFLSVSGCEGQQFCVQSGRAFAPYGSLTLLPDLNNLNGPYLLNGRLIGFRGGGIPFTAYITINLRCNVNVTSPSLTLDSVQGVPGAFVTMTASFHAPCTHLSNSLPQGWLFMMYLSIYHYIFIITVIIY